MKLQFSRFLACSPTAAKDDSKISSFLTGWALQYTQMLSPMTVLTKSWWCGWRITFFMIYLWESASVDAMIILNMLMIDFAAYLKTLNKLLKIMIPHPEDQEVLLAKANLRLIVFYFIPNVWQQRFEWKNEKNTTQMIRLVLTYFENQQSFKDNVELANITNNTTNPVPVHVLLAWKFHAEWIIIILAQINLFMFFFHVYFLQILGLTLCWCLVRAALCWCLDRVLCRGPYLPTYMNLPRKF